MEIKYTKHFLNKLEDLLSESQYVLRYEKGSFKSGYCILHTKFVIIVNKYFSMEGKINSLVEIVKQIGSTLEGLSEKNQQFLKELSKITV